MAQPSNRNVFVLGLDVGDARVGLAVAGTVAKLPRPIETLPRDKTLFEQLSLILQRESISVVVIGIPRNLSGEETAQSQSIREFTKELEATLRIHPVFVDESLSSTRADQWLEGRKGTKISQDSVAACFILKEYFDIIDSA
jgi:putative Holliday junction resolvase